MFKPLLAPRTPVTKPPALVPFLAFFVVLRGGGYNLPSRISDPAFRFPGGIPVPSLWLRWLLLTFLPTRLLLCSDSGTFPYDNLGRTRKRCSSKVGRFRCDCCIISNPPTPFNETEFCYDERNPKFSAGQTPYRCVDESCPILQRALPCPTMSQS